MTKAALPSLYAWLIGILVAVLATSVAACGASIPSTAPMPNVVGMKLDVAKSTLEGIGLKVETNDATGKNRSVWQPSNWVVTGQGVKADEMVNKGDTVRLAIDKGENDRTVKPDENRSSGDDLAAYAASIKQSVLDGAALQSTTDACSQGIDWICLMSDIRANTKAVVVVTVQITEKDKAFGERVARGVYNFASSAHPKLEWVQVNNASGRVLANEKFR